MVFNSFNFSVFAFTKQKMSISSHSGINQTPVQTVTDMTSYFFRNGKKASIDKITYLIFKKYAIDRNKHKKNVLSQPKMYDFFESFFISATPFLGLKTRRKHRGNVIINKVVALSPSIIKRKSFSSFSSMLKNSKNSTKSFKECFFSEINNLYFYNRKTNAESQNQAASSFYEKHALLYKTAYNSFTYKIKKLIIQL